MKIALGIAAGVALVWAWRAGHLARLWTKVKSWLGLDS